MGSSPTAALTDDVLVYDAPGGQTAAVDARSGVPLWAQPFSYLAPTSDGRGAYLYGYATRAMTEGGLRVVKVRARDGALVWERADHAGGITRSMDSTMVLLATQSRVTRLDASTGDERWSVSVPQPLAGLVGSGRRVFVSTGCPDPG
jgi:outer membrane protein assembly factor BamB